MYYMIMSAHDNEVHSYTDCYEDIQRFRYMRGFKDYYIIESETILGEDEYQGPEILTIHYNWPLNESEVIYFEESLGQLLLEYENSLHGMTNLVLNLKLSAKHKLVMLHGLKILAMKIDLLNEYLSMECDVEGMCLLDYMDVDELMRRLLH